MEIQALQTAGTLPQEKTRSGGFREGNQFADVLGNMIEKTNNIQQEAELSARKFAVGESEGVHDTMIALEKADLSFRLLMQVRNKVMDAYQELTRMQI